MMETTTLTIHLPKDVGLALEKQARSRGRRSSDLAAEIVSNGLKHGKPKDIPTLRSSLSAKDVVNKTFGNSPRVKRKDLISLAEDEEFSGY